MTGTKNTEERKTTMMRVTKKELTDLIREVQEPPKNKTVVASVRVRDLKKGIARIVSENLSAIQTVATLENNRIFDGAVQVVMNALAAQKPAPVDAVTKHLVNAAVAAAAIPVQGKEQAASQMQGQISQGVNKAITQGMNNPGDPKEVSQQLKADLRRAVFQALKAAGTPEQVPQVPPVQQ